MDMKDIQKLVYGEHYHMCPIYVNFQKYRNLSNEAMDGQFIAYMPLKIGENNQNFWIKRNVCILCYNELYDE